jgi:hypothetical protein
MRRLLKIINYVAQLMALIDIGNRLTLFELHPKSFVSNFWGAVHSFLVPWLEAQEHLCQVGVVVEVVDKCFALI